MLLPERRPNSWRFSWAAILSLGARLPRRAKGAWRIRCMLRM
jgi:hypothetical protein